MPNQRAKGQKLLTLPASEQFIRDIDSNLLVTGYSNRSQFIRDAIIEKLLLSGIKLPKELALSPSRPKGGAVKYSEHRPSSYVMNEKASSKKVSGAGRLLRKAAASEHKLGPK
jgi:hypothetical protein